MTPGGEEAAASVDVSIVIPVFNDGATLAETCDRLERSLQERGRTYEVLLVDDGSTDDSWTEIARRVDGSSCTVGIRLARNAGQTAAWCAGFERASGRWIVTLDADLDTHPEDVLAIVDALASGADVANGAREGRSMRRGLPSRAFNARMRRRGLPYTDMGCGTIGLTAAVARAALEHGELRRGYRFKVVVAQLASTFVEVPVRCGAATPSSYRLADLLSAGMEAELATRRTVLVWPSLIVAIVAGASAMLAVAATIGWVLAGTDALAPLAGAAAIVAFVGISVAVAGFSLNLAFRAAQQRSAPFSVVAEVLGLDR